MTIEPDTKSWTWVLDRPCPECGLDVRQVAVDRIGPAVLANAEAWGPVLKGPGVRSRPDPSTWSPLEYACHVRDVLRLYDVRLQLMLEQDDPLFADWDQDAAAVDGHYGEQDPDVVAGELAAAAATVAASFDALPPEQWARPGRRSDGAQFTVASFGRYFLHDPVHHLHDVRARPRG
jgi:hypothetical protein